MAASNDYYTTTSEKGFIRHLGTGKFSNVLNQTTRLELLIKYKVALLILRSQFVNLNKNEILACVNEEIAGEMA